jgi:hypothetical protein
MLVSAVEFDITPPVGTGMDGYAARQGNSLGVHDPLLGQLLYLDGGDRQAILISLDLLAVGLEFTTQVRQRITQATGVPGERILLACSHTHSGAGGFLPRLPGLPSFQEPELKLALARQLAGASAWAKQELKPACLGAGRGAVAGIGTNRNQPEAHPIDDEVIVLRVDDESGRPLAVWMNYGCHPTVLGYQNRYISADYPGATRAALRRIYPDTIFMFANGAAGDVSARFTRREQTFAEVERLGRLLAGGVLQVMQTIQATPEAGLDAQVAELELNFRPFPTSEIAQRELARRKSELEALRASGAAHGDIRIAMTRMEGADGQAAMAEELAGRTSRRSQVQALSIGELGLVGLPGEAFTGTALEIKAGSPKALTAVVSYANDYQGYFPDARAVEEASYEALISPFGVEVAERLREVALELLMANEGRSHHE